MRSLPRTSTSLRARLLVAVAAAAMLASVFVPQAATADAAADEAPISATDIPTPDAGDYEGSTGEDEANPGSYAETQEALLQADTLKGFDPGNLISDQKMYTSGTMSTAQIQRFLDGKVTTCQSGYTCLKDFTQTTRTKAANSYCSGTYQGASRESAAAIISKASKACGVSEKVLLVMLQKEQGLVTHVWPSDWRYRIAMGYGCPDGAACDAQYFGFQNQVYMAAKQLRRYTLDDAFNWYPVGRTSQVRWHPNASCGSGPVTIRNNATAALYYYTPYQPNRAALAAGYGAANDACASYGNRNFVNYYTDWFGGSGGGSAGSGQPAATSVHRFWSSTFDNAHFYTANAQEAQKLRSSDRNWVYEGTDFRVWPASNGSCREGSVAVHRFWSSPFESHFFTANSAEAQHVRASDRNWTYEGLAFCTAKSGTPVYRFWSEKFDKHFYTANQSEANSLRRTDPNWTFEGTAFYAP
ncbi:MAG TPA: hypothetical protein H9800_05970 [Candidatus Microbacterium stercoravium]|uniref:DUF5648 domain-containing protein n=1 Tax=Candidatus Microbacterium stercoravium TaxID=2838697 RepID=A0A9D2H5N2_9MICO|nr:hypothetical protein [Candidatus Microbacterium stercoravium]